MISTSYAPEGYNLCSVALLQSTMEKYRGKEDDLDNDVRTQLANWFGDFSADIMLNWERKGDLYEITGAQPSQLGGPFPASVHRGRDCKKFRGVQLPQGCFVCGDHMSTASLNGAIESGVNAADAALGSINNDF